jgi:hypothetical protein
MKRSSILVLGLAALLALLARPAQAEIKVGIRGGYYTEVKEPFVGGELLARIAHRVYFNPNVEYVFVENATYTTWNADFHYDLPTGGSTYVWLGAGLAVVRFDPEGPGGANNDTAANFLAGLGFRGSSVIPYFQAKVIAKDQTEFVLAFGLRF